MWRRVGGLWRVARRVPVVALAVSATIPMPVATFAAELAIETRVVSGAGAGAGTLEGALVLAYQNNPQLNAQRAATRAADENVPNALAGYRPRVTGTSSLTEQYLDNVTKSTSPTGAPLYIQNKGAVAVSNFGLTTTQTLYNGFQTGNRTRQAEGQVFASRETLRSTEQSVLLNGATAYMNFLRDAAILELQRSNVNVLEVTLRQTRDRFSAGEVTRTDVAQAESSLAAGRAQLASAESNYITSRANYRQVFGVRAAAAAGARHAGRSALAAHHRGCRRPRAQRASEHHHRDVQRRHRRSAGQDRRRGAVPDRGGSRQRAENLRLDRRAHGAGNPVCLARRPAHGPALPGRRRVFRHQAVQGNPGTAPARSRYRPRSGAVGRSPGLGSARSGQGADQSPPPRR